MLHRYRKHIFVIVASLLLFFACRAWLFESYERPTVEGSERYNYLGDDPLDLELMYKVIDNHFENVQLIADSEVDFESLVHLDSSAQSSLFIYFDAWYLSDDWLQKLREITEGGAHVLVIGQSPVPVDENVFLQIETVAADSLSCIFGGAAMDYVVPKVEGASGLTNFHNITLPERYHSDIQSVSTFEYKYASRIKKIGEVDSLVVDTSYVMLDYLNGSLAVDALLYYFTNFASRESIYYNHLSHVLGGYDVSHVYLVKTDRYNGQAIQNPLSYVTSFAGPKYAILLLLLLTVLYLYNGRRRERAVPLVSPVYNTTMDFVDTVSRLYLKYDDGEQLINKMMQNFYRHIEARYHVAKESSDYWSRISRISKVPDHLIEQLSAAGRKIETHRGASGLDYKRLHMLLTQFYKQAK